MGLLIDLTGQRFGLLTVRERAGVAREKKAAWLCDCDCGGTRIVCSRELRNGQTRSCGCIRRATAGALNRTHGKCKTREYNSWMAAQMRCYNPKAYKFSDYGGRGIVMCDEWRKSFVQFLQDMGNCPAGHTLDRINSDGNYEAGNCRWATYSTQTNNRRVTVHVFVNGERMTARDASSRFGLRFNTVRKYREQSVDHLIEHR